jgi:hypothetical protein
VLLTGCMGRSQVVVQSLPADVLSARCCWLCLALRDQVIDWPCGATKKTGTRMQPAHRTLGTDSGTVATGRLGGGARCWEHNTTPRHSALLCAALHYTVASRGMMIRQRMFVGRWMRRRLCSVYILCSKAFLHESRDHVQQVD